MTTEVQRKNIEIAAQAIAPLAAEHNIVVVHGNGPQVGLLSLQADAYRGAEPYPLDVPRSWREQPARTRWPRRTTGNVNAFPCLGWNILGRVMTWAAVELNMRQRTPHSETSQEQTQRERA